MDRRLLILISIFTLGSAAFFAYRKLVYKPEAINYTIKPNGAINAGDSIAFDDQTPGASRWKWDFGDGEFSADQNGHHTYLAAGNYKVNLTVYGPFGVLKSNKENIVTVQGGAPTIVPTDTVAAPVIVQKEEPKPATKPAVVMVDPIKPAPQKPTQAAKPKPAHHEAPKKGNVLEDLGDGEVIRK